MDDEFDYVNREVKSINDELQTYLKKQEKYFGCRLSFVGSDKKRFQIEVPDKNCHRIDDNYHLEGQRKGYKRYHTEETKVKVAKLTELIEIFI